MIFGVGVDIASVQRMKAAMERHPRLRERLFTQAEIETCSQKSDPYASFAARFAAKEAFAKALGTGLATGLRWTDIEVTNLAAGRPALVTRGNAAELLKGLGDGSVHLSLTHDRGIAAAVCLIEVPSMSPTAPNH